MIHKLNLIDKYFDLILLGEKVLEGRLNDEKRKLINIGDEIIFNRHSDNSTMVAVVEDKYYFDDFEQMADKLDKKELGFAVATKQEMIDTYNGIYDRERVKKYGVVIFIIKKS